MSDWDKFVGPVCEAFDEIRTLPQNEKRLRLWWIAKEALYQLGVGEGFINENDHQEPVDLEDTRARTDLLNTKERLIYHLVKLVAEMTPGDDIPEACVPAIDMLTELGYPWDGNRWNWMLENGEPGLSARWSCDNCREVTMGGGFCVHCGVPRQ